MPLRLLSVTQMISFELRTKQRRFGRHMLLSDSLTADQHGADGEDLLGICVGRDVAKADAGEAAEGEVQSSDVGAPDRRAPQSVVPVVRRFQSLSQLVEPT